jgi:hypothetical protein
MRIAQELNEKYGLHITKTVDSSKIPLSPLAPKVILKVITSKLAQIIFKMQSEMAAFSVCIDIYIEKTNGFIK